MKTLNSVCRYIRSKNAGPFWITVDIFFKGPEEFQKYATSDALSAEAFATVFGVDPKQVKMFHVAPLNVLKISYPRPAPQGWKGERDMHGGQQFVSLLGTHIG